MGSATTGAKGPLCGPLPSRRRLLSEESPSASSQAVEFPDTRSVADVRALVWAVEGAPSSATERGESS